MLCSIAAATTTTPKPTSNNWLDRLRSSRGFPEATDLDLDHALSNLADSGPSDPPPHKSDDDSSNAVESKSAVNRAGASPENGNPDWLGIMSSVIAELFIMGDSESRNASQIRTKRSSRKQRNPRICAVPKPPLGAEEDDGELLLPRGLARREEGAAAGTPPATLICGGRSGGGGFEVKATAERDNAGCEDAEREEYHEDLKAFSRSEVTVIDTSCASWKFDRMLFRRKNVWKVREKKRKGASAGMKKKRKAMSSCDENIESSLGAASKEHAALSHEERRQQDEERVEAYRTADVKRVPNKRRFPFSRPPRNLRKGGLPNALVKGGSTDRKMGQI